MIHNNFDKQILNTKFYLYYLLSYMIQKKIKVMTTGSAQPVINLEQIEKFPILIPPYEEQCRIAEIITNIDENIKIEQNYRSNLEDLKKGLMQVLLTGKVRVKV